MHNEERGVRKRKRGEEAPDLSFGAVLDYRRAGVQQRHRVKDGFTTDGVCARVQRAATACSAGGFMEVR